MPTENHLIKTLEEAIQSNLQNEQFGVEELAEAVGMSRSNLHRKLQSLTGQSVSQFIREYRLERALELLQNENLTASEVSHQVGFGSATYFSKSFHEYFGFTPGEAKQKDPKIGSPSSSTVKKKMLPMAVAFFVLAMVAVWYFGFRNSGQEGELDKSIVVLPLENLSKNPDQDYFASGVMDGLLNNLFKITDLKVVSKPTAMRYEDSELSIKEIARELKVSYVLTGGVQELDDHVRVSIQLIDAVNDVVLWAEQYDRPLINIFNIQSEISRKVTTELDARLSRNQIKEFSKPITQNSEAYKLYLRGRYLVDRYWSLDRIEFSQSLFRQAIELDSGLAKAYLWMGYTFAAQGAWYGRLDASTAYSLCMPYYEKALKLDSKDPELYYAMSLAEYFFRWDFKAHDSLLHIANQLVDSESYYDPHLDLMLLRYDTVREKVERMIENDPFVNPYRWDLAYAYLHTGEPKEKVLSLIEEAFQLHPAQEAYYDHFGNLYNAMGMYKEAISTLEKGLEISAKRHASMVAHLAVANHKLGYIDNEKALVEEILKRIKSNEPEIKVFLAHYYAAIGDSESAFKWLYESYEDHEVDMLWLQADPNLRKLQNDPRYLALIQKVGFPEGFVDQNRIDMR